MGTEIDSAGAKSRYLAALRDHSPVERGRHKVMLHHSPERELPSPSQHQMTSNAAGTLRQAIPPPPPPPPPPRVAAGAQSIVSKWADRSMQRESTTTTSTTTSSEPKLDVDSTSDFFIPVESPPPPPPPRSSFSSSSAAAASPSKGSTSPTSQSTLSAWKQRQLGRSNTLIPPPISASPKQNVKQPRFVKQASKHTSSIPSPSSPSSLQNQPWVKKRNLSVSTLGSEAPAVPTASASASSEQKTQQPPPQLAHQKSQWDAQRDIPRGLVAQKVAGQQQKLRESTTLKPRVSTTTSSITSTSSSGSNAANLRLSGRMAQPTPEGSLQSSSSSTSTPSIPTLEDVTPVQPPPSPRHARQLSPNYNNGGGPTKGHLEKDERLWGASSTSPRLAAAAAATNAKAPSLSSPRHAAKPTLSPRHAAKPITSPRHATKSTTSPRHAVKSTSSPRNAKDAFADPFSATKSRYSIANVSDSNTAARQQAPFPDRSSAKTNAAPAAAAPAPTASKLEWNAPGFAAPPPPPPPPSSDDSPEFTDYHKDFSGNISPSGSNSWQPKMVSPKGRLNDNFFVQADSPRRSSGPALDPPGLEAPPMFWGDESIDEEREDFPFKEPEPVKSPSLQRTSEKNNDPFTDLRSSSTNTTTTTTTQAARGGGSGWPSLNTAPAPEFAAATTAAAATTNTWSTSRFVDDDLNWFEKGHVFSTDTNESGSLQNSVAEQKALLGGSTKHHSSSSSGGGGGAYAMEEDAEEKKLDEMTTTTATSPRSLGSPEELASQAPRKSKTFPPVEGKSKSLEGKKAETPPSTKSLSGSVAGVTHQANTKTSSPSKTTSPPTNKGWLMTSNSADSASKSASSSNATTSVEDEASVPVNAAALSSNNSHSSTKETNTKKNRFGILNIFGTGKNKKNKESSGASVNSKQGGRSVSESVTSKPQTEPPARITPRAAASKDQASYSGGSYTKPSPELLQSKSHEASSFNNVPYHGSLTYNQSEGDDTTISEMTNPTVFQSTKKELEPPEPVVVPSLLGDDDFHQATTPKTQLRNEQRPFQQPSVATNSSPTEIDPFDVNSPVFASGDPFGMFGVKHPKESFSVSDPFFDAAEDVEEPISFINPEITTLEEPDPPLEHVELLSSDDEDEAGTKRRNSPTKSVPLNLPEPPDTPEPVLDDSSSSSSEDEPEEEHEEESIQNPVPEASIRSDPLLPTLDQMPSVVSSSKSVPEISAIKTAATARSLARSRSAAAKSDTPSNATDEKPTPEKLSTERSVPTVAPRFFASVAKSRKRTGLASSASLPEQQQQEKPVAMSASSENLPAKDGSEPIPITVDVSKARLSKSPKSAARAARDAPTVPDAEVTSLNSYKTVPESSPANDTFIASPEDAESGDHSTSYVSLATRSVAVAESPVERSKADIGKSPAVARSFRDSSESLANDHDQGSLAAESAETREPDSVESARLSSGGASANASVLMMRRRNEKRRQLKVQEQENAAKQQESLNKRKTQTQKASLAPAASSSPYLVRFNQKKPTPTPPLATTTREVAKELQPDTSALLPPPPAIERIHADFDREISKLIPKVSSAASSTSSSIRGQARELKDLERKKSAAPVPEDGSISSSVSSYRSRGKPRSILRKARRGIPETEKQSTQNINDIVDPMHRAGLRLLAAAIIPIQSAARRFLSKREAVSRLWAIVVIQSYLRRWLAEQAMSKHFASIEIQTCFRRWTAQNSYKRYRAAVAVQTCFRRWTAERWFKQYRAATSIQTAYRGSHARSTFKRQVHSAISIQTLFRGWFARDCLLYQHYSAMQIQRMARGYLATIYVYEYIYKVTIVQSCYRRKMAIDDAAYRLSFIMQLQSVVRGYLARRNLALATKKAIVIQSAWRCYYGRMSFRFDLIDIIIVQNHWRRRLATRQVSKMRHERRVRSATTIQARWRSYDCTMNYLHYLADVLIAQSAVRRWSARRRVADIRFTNAVMIQKVARSFLVRNRIKKNNAAVAIQRTWRGFVCYADYMFTVADIVIIQTKVRSVLAKRETEARRFTRNYNAAVEIQRRWRGFADYQRALVTQADIIICQSTARRYLALKRFKQTVRIHQAAIKIQSARRGYTCRRDFVREVSANIIARSWRRYATQQEQLRQRSATCIARSWKLYQFRSDRDIASIIIQKYWRRFVKETEYFIMKFEYQAATTIQSAWRRFWNFSNFVIMLDSSIRLQSCWRRFRDQSNFLEKKHAAIAIQTTSRSFMAKKRVNRMVTSTAMIDNSKAISAEESLAVTRLQSVIRGRRIRLAVRLYLSARRVQSWVRGTFARYAVKLYLSARKIQCRFRGARVRVAVHLYLSARQIQAKWRGYRLRHPYVNFISARRIQTAWRCTNARHAYTRYIAARRIQTGWRCSKARRDYTILRGEILAATLIQAAWRGFLCYTDYIFTVADVIAAQRVARMYLARKQFLALRDDRDREIAAVQVQRYWRGYLGRHSASFARALHDRDVQQHVAAVQIQRVWRGYDQKQIYWYVLGCAIQIQRFARGRLVRERMKAETWAATTVQALVRRYFCRLEHHKRMLDAMLAAVAVEEVKTREAATKIQLWWGRNREQDRRNTAAIVIQRFFLMVKAEVDREIQAEKKRRKMRKKQKNRTPQDDDDILERVWMSTISQDETETNVVKYAVTTAAIELGRARTPGRSSSTPRTSQHGADPGTSVDGDTTSLTDANQKQSDHFQFNQSSPRKMQERATPQAKVGLKTPVRKKHLLPPTYTNGDVAPVVYNSTEQQLPETVRLRPGTTRLRGDDDAASEVSGLTTGSSVYRVPPSRLETLSRKEMDEDFSLEEAWIDAEIRNVKERKRTENRENTPIDYIYPFPSPGKRASSSSVQRTPLSRDSPQRTAKTSRRPKHSS